MKNIYAAFATYATIWNHNSAITHKCGRVVLFLTSLYFAISKLILLFSYSFHVPCIILSNVYLCIVCSIFLFNWSQSKASVVNEISHLFFWSSKIFFCSFQLFENGHIHNVVSTLINVMKVDVANNSTVSTLSNVVNINDEIDNVDLTLFNFVNFNVDIHNVFQRWFDIARRRNVISP